MNIFKLSIRNDKTKHRRGTCSVVVDDRSQNDKMNIKMTTVKRLIENLKC